MTLSDTSSETIGRLFFSQVRDMTLGATKKKSYRGELGSILEDYAPEASKLYRNRLARFAVYR